MSHSTKFEDYDRNLEELEIWFKNNKKLPNEIDRILLRRFYQCMYYDIQGTKSLIETNYAMRNKHPHIFLQRDPNDIDSQKTFAYADFIPLPGLTPQKYKVCCYRLNDYDPNKVRHTEDTKAFFMVTDCRFIYPDNDINDVDQLAEGEVQIFDMNGYTMRHLRKITISTLRIYLKFLQEALPIRLKAIHIINCPSYLDRIISVLKPFISKEVFKMIHFHRDDIEPLYTHVPREMLPVEYGGKAGSLTDLKTVLLEQLKDKRNYLINPDHWVVVQDDSTKDSSNRWKVL